MGRMMLNPPSPEFSPLAELEIWLERCQVLRGRFGHDAGALEDIAASEREVRAALEKRSPAGTRPPRRTTG